MEHSIFFMVSDVTAWSLTAVATVFLIPLTLHLWVPVLADLVVHTGMQIQYEYRSPKVSGYMEIPRRQIVPLRTTRRLLRIQLIAITAFEVECHPGSYVDRCWRAG